MTHTRTIRAKTPADLLAIVPSVFGFHPEDSIVVLTLGDGADPCYARVDMPTDESEFSYVVEPLARAMRRNAGRRVALVAYSDDHELSCDLVDALTDELGASGVSVPVAVRADGERWYDLTGCPGTCCPEDGTPYDLSSHVFTAQAVLDGRVTLRNREELADSLVGTDLDDMDRVGEGAATALRRLEAASRHPLGPPNPDGARTHLVQEAHWVRARVRRFLADGDWLDPEDAGRMAVALVSIEVRDVAWAEMQRSNARGHVDLWRDLVRRCPSDMLAAPAALLGFAAWLHGDGALAWCAVERCQSVEPDYTLAGLLSTALTNAVPPSTWRPLPEDQLTLLAG